MTERRKVLFVDGELKRGTFKDRTQRMLRALGVSLERVWLRRISTRGKAIDIGNLKKQILHEHRRHGPFGCIIIDPVYKYYGRLDENSNSDMSEFYGILMEITDETGALVIPVHHHSKGQQAMKRSLDRASGAGAMGRTVDYNLDIMAHAEDAGKCEKYVFSITRRDLEPLPDFSVDFVAPIFVRDDLTKPAVATSSKNGSEWDVLDAMELSRQEAECDCEVTDCDCPKWKGIASGELLDLVKQKGIAKDRFYRMLKKLKDFLVERSEGRSVIYGFAEGVQKVGNKWKLPESPCVMPDGSTV